MTTMKHRDAVRLLEANGFYFEKTGRHDIYSNANGMRIPLPSHREVAPGTLRDILKMIVNSKNPQRIEGGK